jgi:L-iditol 2-dehydrogenase
MCLKLLVASGVRTIVAGGPQDGARLEAAARLGASAVVDASREDLSAIVARETGGQGVDVAFEVAGVPASVQTCLAAVRRRGRVVQVGVCGAEVPLPVKQVLLKEVELLGSLAHSVETWDRVMRIFERRVARFDDLITHRLPLTAWKEALELVERREGLKVVLVPA